MKEESDKEKQMKKEFAKLDFQTKLIEIFGRATGDKQALLCRKHFELGNALEEAIASTASNNEAAEKLLSMFEQFINILNDFKEENK